MRFKTPISNAINYAIVFGVITYSIKNVFSFSPILAILIWAIIGFIVGLLIELIFHKKQQEDPFSHKRGIPDKISTKLVLIPTIFLVALIIVSALFMTGHNLFNLSGQTTKESEDDTKTDLNISENSTTTEETTEEFSGKCEEKKLERKCQFIEGEELCTHEEEWNRAGYKCNSLNDCINQLDTSGKTYDEENIRCNTNSTE